MIAGTCPVAGSTITLMETSIQRKLSGVAGTESESTTRHPKSKLIRSAFIVQKRLRLLQRILEKLMVFIVNYLLCSNVSNLLRELTVSRHVRLIELLQCY